MWQTIVVVVVVAVAVFMVARRLWNESREGSCGGCEGCQAPPAARGHVPDDAACRGCDKKH